MRFQFIRCAQLLSLGPHCTKKTDCICDSLSKIILTFKLFLKTMKWLHVMKQDVVRRKKLCKTSSLQCGMKQKNLSYAQLTQIWHFPFFGSVNVLELVCFRTCVNNMRVNRLDGVRGTVLNSRSFRHLLFRDIPRRKARIRSHSLSCLMTLV